MMAPRAFTPSDVTARPRGPGRRLTGIDTGLDGNRYTGSAPFTGAGEPRAR